MKRINAFTLIEMLITISIITVISGILLQVYVFSSKINVAIFEQKNLFSQILTVNQILQNEIESSEINFECYKKNKISLTGFVDKLCLLDSGDNIEIYTTGCKLHNFYNFQKEVCVLAIKKHGKEVILSNKKKILFSKISFKIIPYLSNKDFFENVDSCKWNFLGCLNYPGVWLLGTVYSPSGKFKIPLELFFNTRLNM